MAHRKNKQTQSQSEVTNNASDAEFGIEFTQSNRLEKEQQERKNKKANKDG